MCFLLLYRFFFEMIACHTLPIFFHNLESNMEETDCPICLESLHTPKEDSVSTASSTKVCDCPSEEQEGTKRLECGHSFHKTCISSWFDTNEEEQTCPVCRLNVSQTQNPGVIQPCQSNQNTNEESASQMTNERFTTFFSESVRNQSLGRFTACIYFIHILFSFINTFFYLYVNGGELMLFLFSLILISPNICFLFVGTMILLQQVLCIPTRTEMLVPCFLTLFTATILVFLRSYSFLSSIVVHTLQVNRREREEETNPCGT